MASLEKTGEQTVSTTCDAASSGGAVKKKRQASSSFRLLHSLREVLVSGRSSSRQRQQAVCCTARLSVYRAPGDPVVKAKSSDNVLLDDVTTSQHDDMPGSYFLPSRRLSMSADCVFAANIDMMSDFTSSVTGCESADNMDVKTRDESKLSMSVEALPNDDVVEVCASESTDADDVVNSSPVADVDLSAVSAVRSSQLDHSAALHRRDVRPPRRRPVTQAYPETSARHPVQSFKERPLVSSTANVRPSHSLEDISDKDTTEQRDTADTSSSSESPPKLVARSSKAPADFSKMILHRHAVMFSSQTAGRETDQDTTTTSTSRAPVPAFRKRHQPTSSTTRHGDDQRGTTSQLTAISLHRRSHSSGGTDVLPAAEKITPTEQHPPTRTAAQHVDKSEPVENITTEKPADKPAVKTKAADTSELAAKLSVKAEILAEKQRTKMEKSDGKLSVAATAGEPTTAAVMKSSFKAQTTTVNNAVMKRSFKAATKPNPPTKPGLVTEKAENAIKSSASPVIAKRGLSSTTTSEQEHTDASGKNVVEKGNKFPGLEIPKVKLRSTSPALMTGAVTASCQPGRGDDAANDKGLVTGSERNDEDVASVGSASDPLTTGDSLGTVKVESGPTSSAEKNKKTLPQVTLKSVTKSDGDSRATSKDTGSSESTASRLIKSANTGDSSTSGEMSAADAKQSEAVRHGRECAGSRSEQSGAKVRPAAGKAAPSATQSSALVRTTTWRQTEPDVTSTADKVMATEKPQSSEHRQTSARKDIASEDATEAFVPVSKRVTRFDSSLSGSRQFVGKSTGYGAKSSTLDRNLQTDSSQSTDVSSGVSSGVTNSTVAARAASFRACVTDAQTKTAASAAAEADDTGNRSESVQPTQQGPRACEAKKEVAVRAAAVSRWPPQEMSNKISAEKPTGKTTAGQCVEEFKVAEKTSVKAEAAAEKRVERVEEKSSSVMGDGQQTASKTSIPSCVKPSGTSLSESQPEGSLGESASTTPEPDTTASNPSQMSQKLSSVPPWAKPSRTSSKKLSKDNVGETCKVVEPENVTAVQSEKPSSGSQSATAASAKMTTSAVAVETTCSMPTIMSTSVVAGPVTTLSAVDFAASNRGRASDVISQPVTSSEPPWLAVARAKTRVWTEGKM